VLEIHNVVSRTCLPFWVPMLFDGAEAAYERFPYHCTSIVSPLHTIRVEEGM